MVTCEHCAELEEKVRLLEESQDEYVALTDRLSALLTGVANGLKGKPKRLHWHDWSDLPQLARDTKNKLDGMTLLYKMYYHARKKHHARPY